LHRVRPSRGLERPVLDRAGWMAVVMRRTRSSRRTSWTHPPGMYRRRALTHYAQGAAVLAPATIGALTFLR
jgi:hypothetical protein